MRTKQILVIGAGPIGLFTAWTISRATGNDVEIHTTNREIRSKYSVNINGLFIDGVNWYPQFLYSIANYNNYGLIIIAKPYRLVHGFLLMNKNLWMSGNTKILVLSSFSIKPINFSYSHSVCFAWPNTSVEIDDNVINSTASLELELWMDRRNENSIKLRNTISSYGINTKCINDLNYFLTKAMLTYATYMVLLEKRMSFTQKPQTWIEIILRQSQCLNLDIESVEQIFCGGNIKNYSIQLFKELHTYILSNNHISAAVNLNILMKDSSRLENYIKDYENQIFYYNDYR